MEMETKHNTTTLGMLYGLVVKSFSFLTIDRGVVTQHSTVNKNSLVEVLVLLITLVSCNVRLRFTVRSCRLGNVLVAVCNLKNSNHHRSDSVGDDDDSKESNFQERSSDPLVAYQCTCRIRNQAVLILFSLLRRQTSPPTASQQILPDRILLFLFHHPDSRSAKYVSERSMIIIWFYYKVEIPVRFTCHRSECT